MTNDNTESGGFGLILLIIGNIITQITMSHFVGIMTAIGAVLYVVNQGYIAYSNFRKKKR